MEEKSFEYKGKKIEIKDLGKMKKIIVDGKEINCMYNEEKGTYNSHTLPYLEYKSIEKLAQDLVKFSPDLKSTIDKNSIKG